MKRQAQPKSRAAAVGKQTTKTAKAGTKRAVKPAAARLSETTATLSTSRRRSASALVDAGRTSVAGLTALLRRRIEILRDTLSELRTVARVVRVVGARESVAHLDGLARGAMQLTMSSVRELSSLAVSTQKEAFDILPSRLKADLAEFRQLRSKRSAAEPK